MISLKHLRLAKAYTYSSQVAKVAKVANLDKKPSSKFAKFAKFAGEEERFIFEERAAILEFDAGLYRANAEVLAFSLHPF